MRRNNRRFALASALALAAALLLAGCRVDFEGLQTLTVDELASWRTGGAAYIVCDANNDETRARHGVIPGAVLLSSYRDYRPAEELGGDLERTTVFYCHSARCGAAADAARRAIAAGYRDVWVLEAGIRGWADAGQPLAPGSRGEAAS